MFEKDIESIKDDDVILKICEITNTDILVKNSEKIPFIVEAYVNKGKFLGIHIKKAINQIAEDKEKIIDIMMKANFKARREIFLALDNKHKEKILKELIEKFVRSEGAYTYWEEPDDFLKAINTPSIDYHGNCESFIGQDSISIARPKGPIYGYFNSRGMLLQAPYDIGSDMANTSFDVVNGKTGLPAKFLAPQQMIDSTRHGHNEFVFERLAYNSKTDKLEKRKPNCIIWIEEGEEKSNNKRWKMTKKAAAQIGVPIVIINRERFLIKEEQKISEMLNEFLNPKEDGEKVIAIEKNLSKIITKFENNYTGNLFAKTELKEKYFTPEQREILLNEIETKIEDLKKEDLNKYYKCIKEMKEVAVSEISKHSDAGDVPEFAWTEIMSKYERKIEEYENALKIANLYKSYKEKEITLEEFNKITASMKNEQKSQEKSEVEIDGN